MTGPARTIVDSAADGTLTKDLLDELIADAARAQMISSYTGDLSRNSEKLFVAAFFTELQNGAADEILDSLRPSFDKAAQEIEKARDVIPAEVPADQFLASASSAAVKLWQGLDANLAVIEAVARIAAQFGCRLAKFPLIEEYTLGDGFRLDDRALFCCDGELESESRLFGRPDPGHRSSPWFRTALRLHAVDSARERYRAFVSAEWSRLTSGPAQQWIDERGEMREMAKPTNPYAQPAEVAK